MVVARFGLVEVFTAVPLGLSCFLPCQVGLCGPPERWVASRLFRCGIPPQGLSASCAPCSGGGEPVAWVQMQLTGLRHFCGRPRLPP